MISWALLRGIKVRYVITVDIDRTASKEERISGRESPSESGMTVGFGYTNFGQIGRWNLIESLILPRRDRN